MLDCTIYFAFIALVTIRNNVVQQALGKLSFLPFPLQFLAFLAVRKEPCGQFQPVKCRKKDECPFQLCSLKSPTRFLTLLSTQLWTKKSSMMGSHYRKASILELSLEKSWPGCEQQTQFYCIKSLRLWGLFVTAANEHCPDYYRFILVFIAYHLSPPQD